MKIYCKPNITDTSLLKVGLLKELLKKAKDRKLWLKNLALHYSIVPHGCHFFKRLNNLTFYAYRVWFPLTLMLLVANLANTKWSKKPENWNPGTWVLIWEYSARAMQWIPTLQGLDSFQKSLHPCALDKSSLSIERVNPYPAKHNNSRGVQQCLYVSQQDKG